MMEEHTPFWHALELAWCGDGALSLHSVRLLDAMQQMISLDASTRPAMESRFEEGLVGDLTRAGFGCADKTLAALVGTLTFLVDPAAQELARALG